MACAAVLEADACKAEVLVAMKALKHGEAAVIDGCPSCRVLQYAVLTYDDDPMHLKWILQAILPRMLKLMLDSGAVSSI